MTDLGRSLGRYGVWSRGLRSDDPERAGELTEAAAELAGLGYGTIWLGGNSGVDHAVRLLDAAPDIVVATGILSIWQHDAADTAARFAEADAAHPGRFLLGLGVSHAVLAEQYRRPVASMAAYLDALDQAGLPAERRVIAALGPKMLALSRDRAAGTHPYLVTLEHTAEARALLGPDAFLAPEVGVVLEPDPDTARAIARDALSRYFVLPNYTNSWLRLGFSEADLTDGGSDRLVDALYVWGDEERVRERLDAFLLAGADHVAVQLLEAGRGPDDLPREGWRRLAGVLG